MSLQKDANSPHGAFSHPEELIQLVSGSEVVDLNETTVDELGLGSILTLQPQRDRSRKLRAFCEWAQGPIPTNMVR